jgi:two-component system, OmpR family, sensor histidine kinase VicK
MIDKLEYSFIKKIGELSDDGAVIFDTSANQFVYANKNFLKIFSFEYDKLIEQSDIVLSFIYAEDLNYLKSRYKELLQKGFINTTEFRLLFKNGTLKHISCDAFLIENDRYMVAFIKDITRIKQHEDYIVKYAAQKDTLLDMLTHNLGGPLLLTKDLLEFLKLGDKHENKDNLEKIVTLITQNTQQCIDIVNDFLREEHYESASIYVRKTRFDVVEKINVTIEKLRIMNTDKHFVFTSELKTLNINSDPVKFFQIIHNILSNAIKYTKKDGTIEIILTELEDKYLFTIKDDGIGMKEDIKKLVFNKRINGETGLKGQKSSGLGLSIAKMLIELIGGEIYFESEHDKGTSFTLSLPKATN